MSEQPRAGDSGELEKSRGRSLYPQGSPWFCPLGSDPAGAEKLQPRVDSKAKRPLGGTPATKNVGAAEPGGRGGGQCGPAQRLCGPLPEPIGTLNANTSAGLWLSDVAGALSARCSRRRCWRGTELRAKR